MIKLLVFHVFIALFSTQSIVKIQIVLNYLFLYFILTPLYYYFVYSFLLNIFTLKCNNIILKCFLIFCLYLQILRFCALILIITEKLCLILIATKKHTIIFRSLLVILNSKK